MLERAERAIRLAGLSPPLHVLSGGGRLATDVRRPAVILDAGPPERELLAWRSRLDVRWGVMRESGAFAWIAPESWAPAPGDVLVLPAMPAEHSGGLAGLAEVVSRLLDPESGCPWDLEQTHQSLKRHLLEEAYEVLDAIDSGDPSRLREELGDLLLQPLMHAEIDRRTGAHEGIERVAHEAAEKLVGRHPHVFGHATAASADEVLRNWDRIKQAGSPGPERSILAGVPQGMAALLRAFEISKRAARAGFEWPDLEAVFAKLREEEAELRAAFAGGDAARVEAEVGDLLFTAANLARWMRVEPEDALRTMLDRFTARFQRMEALAPRAPGELTAAEWDELWTAAKAELPPGSTR
jgi:tetrapyrrole methylase family protein/MazG family protein